MMYGRDELVSDGIRSGTTERHVSRNIQDVGDGDVLPVFGSHCFGGRLNYQVQGDA